MAIPHYYNINKLSTAYAQTFISGLDNSDWYFFVSRYDPWFIPVNGGHAIV